MRQAYRKESIDTTGTYLAVFDFIPLAEWKNKKGVISSEARYNKLVEILSGSAPEATGMYLHKSLYKHLTIVQRKYVVPHQNTIDKLHNHYVEKGYEGAMIKDPTAPYSFKRDWSVMKFKAFHDVDLPIKQLLEGTGKHSGKLGSFVVDYQGVEVQVGSGLTDALRDKIWEKPDAFIGRMIEVRYQEVTPDGSLRFPTFVCFRNDR
jgi:DNA ligase-1